MKLTCKIISIIFHILFSCIFLKQIHAATLNSISVQNNVVQSTVILQCNIIPIYTIFSLHNPERIVIDLSKISTIRNYDIFPIKFIGNNLITNIRANFSMNKNSIRIVCDLFCESSIISIIQKKIGQDYCVILTISKKAITVFNTTNSINNTSSFTSCNARFRKQSDFLQPSKIRNQFRVSKNIHDKYQAYTPIIVAIDAGHGGQDPGATSCHGIYEKNITFSIAKKLKKILDKDSMFKAVMIRDGDYFLSVTERSDLARKKKANLLISIHVDSSLNSHVRGASVWVLSNRRVKSETINWLNCTDRHSELLGGLGDVLINYKDDLYFNYLILDLQFGYAQRESYNVATQILNQLKNVSCLHKKIPEYSNFGVLRSPDIPSVLVETGFISNVKEARLLENNIYQEKIARSLYKGLCSYVVEYNKCYNQIGFN